MMIWRRRGFPRRAPGTNRPGCRCSPSPRRFRLPSAPCRGRSCWPPGAASFRLMATDGLSKLTSPSWEELLSDAPLPVASAGGAAVRRRSHCRRSPTSPRRPMSRWKPMSPRTSRFRRSLPVPRRCSDRLPHSGSCRPGSRHSAGRPPRCRPRRPPSPPRPRAALHEGALQHGVQPLDGVHGAVVALEQKLKNIILIQEIPGTM